MTTPRSRLTAGLLLLVPLLSSCFSAGGASSSASDPSASGSGGRLHVVLAFQPTENYSPHGQDAFALSRLGVAEGLTRLDANGAAAPALAESWSREKGGRSWVFTLREAAFQDGGEVTAQAVASSLNHAAAPPRPPPRCPVCG